MTSRIRIGGCFVWIALVTLAAGCDDDRIELTSTDYVVSIAIVDPPEAIEVMQIEVAYTGQSGEWLSDSRVADCRWRVGGSIRTCGVDRRGHLECAYANLDGLDVDSGSGAIELVDCEFRAVDADVDSDDFEARVTDASASDLSPIDVQAFVTVTPRRPETTTTTDPDHPAPEYIVRFEMGEAEQPVGALQFEVDYAGPGGWIGSHANLDCTWLVESTLQACNDKGGGLLVCAVVDTTGFTGSDGLVECGFASFDQPTPEGFDVFVVDASAPSLEPLDVTVFVSSVTPR